MSRRRALLAPVLLVALAGVARADDTPKPPAAPEPIQLRGAPALVTPPAGLSGEARTTAPGQWRIRYTGPGDLQRLEAQVFPVRASREPLAVLTQALDTLVRNNHFGAFGMQGRRALEVWGRPAAETAIQVSVGGRVARGFARLLLADGRTWAFAWGLVAAPELSRATLARIQAFARSLEPREPAFHTPRFRDDGVLRRTVYRGKGEPPITRAHLHAIASLLEAALGRRFPVATRAQLESMLLEDVRRGAPRTRQGYRASAMDVVRANELPPKERAARMRALGQRILEAIDRRAKQGYAPALGAQRIWTRDAAPAVGVGGDAWQVGTLQAELELAAFLVSILRDEATAPPAGTLARHQEALLPAWKAADPAERRARPAVRADWARLRHAFDTAKPEGRRAFRLAVARALAPRTERGSLGPDPDGRALKRWVEAHRAAAEPAADLARALALSAARRRALIATLGVDAEGYQFGW